MHIATEQKTGVTLTGDQYNESVMAAFAASFDTEEFRQQHGEPDIELSPAVKQQLARLRCAAHIAAHYPQYKQLNILRSGAKADKDKMGAFIDACRAWSNSDNPDPAALEQILP